MWLCSAHSGWITPLLLSITHKVMPSETLHFHRNRVLVPLCIQTKDVLELVLLSVDVRLHHTGTHHNRIVSLQLPIYANFRWTEYSRTKTHQPSVRRQYSFPDVREVRILQPRNGSTKKLTKKLKLAQRGYMRDYERQVYFSSIYRFGEHAFSNGRSLVHTASKRSDPKSYNNQLSWKHGLFTVIGAKDNTMQIMQVGRQNTFPIHQKSPIPTSNCHYDASSTEN